MVELTIAVASACIAAGIAILQFVLPNALALVLTGTLSESQPAVTWSVVSRFLFSSDWPLFLRSDAATSIGVSRKISLVTWTKPVGLLLIAVAAIVTPLGLYDEIGPVSYTEDVEFAYVADSSLIGSNTPARSGRGFKFSRLCAGFLCPGDPNQGNITRTEIYNYTTNETRPYSYYIVPESISPALIDLYQSGIEHASPSLSSFFDIQSRQWTTWTGDIVERRGSLLGVDYKYLSTILMNNRIEPFEGLIVDSISGGIGFRNHSVPVAEFRYGAEWEEDVIWMQPESICVDTNISVSYTGVLEDFKTYEGDLVDRGGFYNLQKINPYYTPENTTREYVFGNAQANPYLYERAYYLAWYNNAVGMEYLNITDPKTNRSRMSSGPGQRFKVNGTITKVSADSTYYPFLKIARGGSMIDMPYADGWNSTLNGYNYDPNPEIPNPHNTTGDILDKATNYCKGALGGDKVNISTLDIGLGYVAGPAVMINQSDPNNASSAATWERPCYVCAAATKVSIKTVRFRYNSTKEVNLNSLEIMYIKDKVYASDAEKPGWGFETPWMNATTTWNLSMIDPLWGFIEPAISDNPNVTILRSEHFYIPASYQTTAATSWGSSWNNQHLDYTPATSGPSAAWAAVFSHPSTDPYTSDDLNQQMFVREMTVNATSTSRLLNLMWTDMAANTMVGTRGIHQARYQPLQPLVKKRDGGSDFDNLPAGWYPVYTLDRRIRYRWIYGIPALLCIGVVGLAVTLALVGMVFGYGTVTRLRWYMFNISSGRVFASYVYPESMAGKSAETKQWIQTVGLKPIQVCGHSTSVDGQCYCRDGKKRSTYVQVEQSEEADSLSSH